MHAWSCASGATGGREEDFHGIVFGDLDDVEVAEAIECSFDGDFGAGVDIEVVDVVAADFAQNGVSPGEFSRSGSQTHRGVVDDVKRIRQGGFDFRDDGFVLTSYTFTRVT